MSCLVLNFYIKLQDDYFPFMFYPVFNQNCLMFGQNYIYIYIVIKLIFAKRDDLDHNGAGSHVHTVRFKDQHVATAKKY